MKPMFDNTAFITNITPATVIDEATITKLNWAITGLICFGLITIACLVKINGYKKKIAEATKKAEPQLD